MEERKRGILTHFRPLSFFMFCRKGEERRGYDKLGTSFSIRQKPSFGALNLARRRSVPIPIFATISLLFAGLWMKNRKSALATLFEGAGGGRVWSPSGSAQSRISFITVAWKNSEKSWEMRDPRRMGEGNPRKSPKTYKRKKRRIFFVGRGGKPIFNAEHLIQCRAPEKCYLRWMCFKNFCRSVSI